MARVKTHEEHLRMVAFGRVLELLRITMGLSQLALARRSGVKRGSISEYERGKTSPDAPILERLLAGMGLQWSALDFGNWFVERLEADCRISEGADIARGTPPAFRTASSLAARLHADVATAHHTAATLSQLVVALEGEEEASSPALFTTGASDRNEERAAAQEQWKRIRVLSRKEQLDALQSVPPEVLWALSEVLCIESQRLCGSDLLKAAALADLSLAAADLAPGDDAFRAKLRGITLAHLGNVLRARGDLHASERTFISAEELWEAGKGAEAGFFEEGLFFALKASLRRAQRRFDEAADLLERAARLAVSPTFRVQVLVSQAKLLEEVGGLEEAVALLAHAKEAVSPDEEPRILFAIWHNLADTLSKLERYEEASALLPEARRHCRGELHRLQLTWTEARVTAGLGAVKEGMALLARVRGEYASRSMAYDNALVSLELAVEHAREGQAEQVKALARHMAPIFQAQEVHREALAALALFRQAAEREGVTAAFAREVLLYLRKARNAPDLRFEGEVVD